MIEEVIASMTPEPHYKGLKPDALALERVVARSVVAPWTPIVNGAHCRVWLGPIDGYGYGKMWLPGGRGVRPHSVVLACSLGPLGMDPGAHTLHGCSETRLCVEAAHLSVGDDSANLLDSFASGRVPRRGARRDWRKARAAGLFVCGCRITPENTSMAGKSPRCKKHYNESQKMRCRKATEEARAYQRTAAAITGTCSLLPKKRQGPARSGRTATAWRVA